MAVFVLFQSNHLRLTYCAVVYFLLQTITMVTVTASDSSSNTKAPVQYGLSAVLITSYEDENGGIRVSAKHETGMNEAFLSIYKKELRERLHSAWSEAAGIDHLIQSNLSKDDSSADYHVNGLVLKAVEDTGKALKLPQGYSRFVWDKKDFDAETEKENEWFETLERNKSADCASFSGDNSGPFGDSTLRISGNTATGPGSVQVIYGTNHAAASSTPKNQERR